MFDGATKIMLDGCAFIKSTMCRRNQEQWRSRITWFP